MGFPSLHFKKLSIGLGPNHLKGAKELHVAAVRRNLVCDLVAVQRPSGLVKPVTVGLKWAVTAVRCMMKIGEEVRQDRVLLRSDPSNGDSELDDVGMVVSQKEILGSGSIVVYDNMNIIAVCDYYDAIQCYANALQFFARVYTICDVSRCIILGKSMAISNAESCVFFLTFQRQRCPESNAPLLSIVARVAMNKESRSYCTQHDDVKQYANTGPVRVRISRSLVYCFFWA